MKPGKKHRKLTPDMAWRITRHEAGHAVVAVALKIPFTYVERGDGEFGLTEVGENNPIDDSNGNWTEEDISRWQQFYAAGAAAERLLYGRYRHYAASKDKAYHEKLEKRWRRVGRRNGWKRDIASAMQFLDSESIERVARPMHPKGRLSDVEVCKILSNRKGKRNG
jgi:hypothetical protein